MSIDTERDPERGQTPLDVPKDLSRNEYMKMCAAARIPVTPTMTKDDLISALEGKVKHEQIALPAVSNAPAPGRTRIKIFRDPSPGASNFPVYASVNGFRVNIPRGIEVDVPHKIVEVLNNATQLVLKENIQEPLNSPKRHTWEESQSYPFQILASTPGNDPKPGAEKERAAKTRLRELHVKKFGSWPTDEELKNAIKNGELRDK